VSFERQLALQCISVFPLRSTTLSVTLMCPVIFLLDSQASSHYHQIDLPTPRSHVPISYTHLQATMDAQLGQLCELLGSLDKDTRKQAENHYVQYRATNLNQLLRSLLHMISTQPNPVSPPVKAMACILLRQLFDSNMQGGVHAARTIIDAAALQELRHGLVEAVTNEP